MHSPAHVLNVARKPCTVARSAVPGVPSVRGVALSRRRPGTQRAVRRRGAFLDAPPRRAGVREDGGEAGPACPDA